MASAGETGQGGRGLVAGAGERLAGVRMAMTGKEEQFAPELALVHPNHAAGARNLVRYLGLRSRDRTGLDDALREETGVAMQDPEVDAGASLDLAEALLHGSSTAARTARGRLGSAKDELRRNTDRLLGPVHDDRRTRVMITLSPGDSSEPGSLRELIDEGVDCFRINCARDDAPAWVKMVDACRAASEAAGRQCRIFMDLAGPKLRIASVRGENAALHVVPGDMVRIAFRPGGSAAGTTADGNALIIDGPVPAGAIRPGEPIWFDDGKAGGIVEELASGSLAVRITSVQGQGRDLMSGRGVNLPGSAIVYPLLTEKDREDLVFIARAADMVGLSFLRDVRTVRLVRDALTALGRPDLPIVVKVENRTALRGLPFLLLEVMRGPSAGVLLARGDLAVECGFTDLPAIQDHVVSLCEAARLPLIWATEVLDRLARRGRPSRAEMTDVAAASVAECILLNRGKHTAEALPVLVALLEGAEGRMYKGRRLLTAFAVPVSHKREAP